MGRDLLGMSLDSGYASGFSGWDVLQQVHCSRAFSSVGLGFRV